MIEGLRADSLKLGDALHQLFMGQDTDDAEAAACVLGIAIDVYIQQNTKH